MNCMSATARCRFELRQLLASNKTRTSKLNFWKLCFHVITTKLASQQGNKHFHEKVRNQQFNTYCTQLCKFSVQIQSQGCRKKDLTFQIIVNFRLFSTTTINEMQSFIKGKSDGKPTHGASFTLNNRFHFEQSI